MLLNLYRSIEGREQLSQLLTVAAQQHPSGLPAHFLEKDLWVVEILRLLFEEQLLGGVDVAFKGGTALSKGWNTIQRFSEDIDLSIHWADLLLDEQGISVDESVAWNKSIQTKSQIKKFRDAQSKRLESWAEDFVTRLNERFQLYAIDELSAELEAGTKGEKIHVQFPRVTQGESQYQLDYILLEFGARNRGRPTVNQPIQTYLSDIEQFKTLAFPKSEVDILSPDYILWEKLTALHQFSTQTKSPSYTRLARHWYDVDSLLLSQDFINGVDSYQAALDVVTMKKNRWAEGGVDYEAVLNGGLCLIPNAERLEMIAKDHAAAIAGGLFYKVPAEFSVIVERLENQQARINEIILKAGPHS